MFAKLRSCGLYRGAITFNGLSALLTPAVLFSSSIQIKPDMQRYAEQKEAAGDAFYASAGTVVHGVHRDRKEAVERMAADIQEQQAKREKYSRRRAFDEGADVDYINERNMKFNQKLERFYGGYTKDIKDNLERGTAV